MLLQILPMKKVFALILSLLTLFSLAACGGAEPASKASADEECVRLTVKDYGEIVIELYPAVAPISVANFKKLVKEGYYDGADFHRVVKNFVIQAGEPAEGKTEPAAIKGEFSSNGVENTLSHTRGVVSMARKSNNYNSASGQFFICLGDQSSLDGEYAAFGKVILGMETADAIAKVTVDSNDRPLEKVILEKAELVPRKDYAAANTAAPSGDSSEADAFQRSDTETNFVRIDVKDYGSIVAELYPDIAPITVANFQKLVKEGFYNGVIFHRVISGFMIQGGDPTGTGTGGPGWTIKGEFTANGVQNDLLHTRGVLSMARQGNPYNDAPYYDTAGSQFFIVHKDYPSLNGKYAAFGKVVAGMDVVDKIAAVQTGTNDKPLTDVVMSEVYFVTKGE